jgi:RNA polymerase sigma factor (TIGR02999 family)
MSAHEQEVTALLADISAGKEAAWDRLLELVYQELHTLAHGALQKGRPGPTVQTTALVNEAFLRLVRDRQERWSNRTHFFSVAARAMRQILVDEFRRRKAAKREERSRRVPLEAVDLPVTQGEGPEALLADLDALDRALDELGKQERHRRKCTVVELRFFVGLTFKETAEVLGVSMATVTRDWEFTRAWLLRHMSTAENDAS